MKKFIILLVGILLLTTGCGKIGKKEVIRDLNKKIQGLKSYYVEGKMEIINNEDVYKYDVYVAYKNKDLFKVSLKNESNNHEQIILKNKEGVYVKKRANVVKYKCSFIINVFFFLQLLLSFFFSH